MRRFAALAMMFFIICALLSGCAFWMSGEHLSIQPHQAQDVQQENQLIEVTSYTQLRNVLKSLVESGNEDAVISISNYNEATIEFYVGTVINYITDSTAVGAYSVDKISYEIGTNRGVPVVAFKIDYNQRRDSIKNLKHVASTDEMANAITEALNACEQSVALYTENYETFDFVRFVDTYANNNPDKVMENPYVSVSTYPTIGAERVVEVTLTYLTEKERLLEMQRQVQAVFSSAELYVKESAQVMDIYSRLYSFLVKSSTFEPEASVTPPYTLLLDGTGDSRAFANVYAAMCQNAGLECSVIVGLRDSESWCWNVLRYRGRYYHVDLLRCAENDEFKLVSGIGMDGYEWDFAAYPIE